MNIIVETKKLKKSKGLKDNSKIEKLSKAPPLEGVWGEASSEGCVTDED